MITHVYTIVHNIVNIYTYVRKSRTLNKHLDKPIDIGVHNIPIKIMSLIFV
jgi:hypothetical protein